ncbi:hypothetical protein FRX31_024071 [Thalictrum thalictroides]|uniref:GRF-type domain-containing protein n=1 Tax=Thalictrum thalictroides TaxID=46969 RepID=A0A7J6VMK6_THATH|nr:hypothetical protein FRX31_024071 [Thalictrum thalictroides]
MSSSSINSSTSCYCGKETPMRISTTDGNPGRKFLGCYRFPAKTCDFFRWVDPPTTPSSIQKKLDYMINRNDELDSKNSALEKKCRGGLDATLELGVFPFVGDILNTVSGLGTITVGVDGVFLFNVFVVVA